MWPALAVLPGRIAWSNVAAGAAVGGSVFTGVGVMVTLAARLHREGVPGPGSRVPASFKASVSLLMFPIALIGAAVLVHGLAQPGASYWLGAAFAGAGTLVILSIQPVQVTRVDDPHNLDTRFRAITRASGLFR